MSGLSSKQAAWYEDKVTAFCNGKGQRWELVTDMTYAAAAVGIGADELIEDCRGRMTDFTPKHASDIRRGMVTAQKQIGNRPPRAYQSRASKPEMKRDPYTGLVRDYIREGGGRTEPAPHTFAAFIGGEPLDELPPNEQTARWLEMFDPSALMFVTAKGRAEHGRICGTVGDYCGGNIRKCSEWLDMARRGVPLAGDVITPNPLTGEKHETIDEHGRRKYSYILQACVASVPYLVIELDDLPLSMQAAFWLGFLRASPLAPSLVSLVHSGGRSIHGLLRVDRTLENWETMRDKLRDHFAVDKETRTITEDGKQKTVYPFRIDGGALSPITKTRIAGAKRDGSGEIQTLLYLRSPFVSRPCSDTAANMCGVCERFSVCGFRNPHAVRGTTILKN